MCVTIIGTSINLMHLKQAFKLPRQWEGRARNYDTNWGKKPLMPPCSPFVSKKLAS